MLFHIILGGITVFLFMLLVNYVNKNGKKVTWWQWLLTTLGFLYGVLVLETVFGFLEEGAPQAALVMGLMMAVVAVIWGVLLGRFVFARKAV